MVYKLLSELLLYSAREAGRETPDTGRCILDLGTLRLGQWMELCGVY